MTTADILDAAADYIAEHGHWKGGKGVGPNGERCASRAISRIAPEGRDVAAHQAFLRFIGGTYIPWWNDAPERTATDVITALRSAAAAVREGR